MNLSIGRPASKFIQHFRPLSNPSSPCMPHGRPTITLGQEALFVPKTAGLARISGSCRRPPISRAHVRGGSPVLRSSRQRFLPKYQVRLPGSLLSGLITAGKHYWEGKSKHSYLSSTATGTVGEGGTAPDWSAATAVGGTSGLVCTFFCPSPLVSSSHLVDHRVGQQ